MATAQFEKDARVEEVDSGPRRNVSKNPVVWFAVACGVMGLAMLPAWIFSVVGGSGSQATARPVVEGEVAHLMVWENPIGRLGSNSGQEIGASLPGSRVEVFDQFLVLKTPRNGRWVVPNGYYSDLKLKP